MQWRANSSQNQGLGNYELSKTNWGWSWLERWIAARPWESRVLSKSISPKKGSSRQTSKVGRNANSQISKTAVLVKPLLANGKGTTKVRRLSYPGAEKPAAYEGSIKAESANNNKEPEVRRLSYPAAEKPAAYEGSIKAESGNNNKEQGAC